MNMYKLTYESDEELGPTGETANKNTPDVNENTADENVIYDRSSSREEKNEKDVRDKERSDTTSSAIANAFAGSDYLSESHKEKERRRNFYAMFRTRKDDYSEYPKKNRGAWIGCKECMLLFYLFVLSIGIVVLAVFFQTLSWKYHMMEDRVSFLEEKVSVMSTSGFAGAPAALEESAPASSYEFSGGNNPKRPPKPSALAGDGSAGCCTRLGVRVDEVEAKLSDVGLNVASRLEQVIDMAFRETKRNYTRLARTTARLSTKLDAVESHARELAMEVGKLHSEELETNGMASLALQEAAKGSSGPRLSSTAFDAHQLKSDLASGVSGLAFTISPVAGIARPLTYNYELINRRNTMDPDTGAYTAPRDGAYLFHVSFCTATDQGEKRATVALVSNGTALEVFRAPDATTIDDVLRSVVPPMPAEVMGDAQVSVTGVKRHSYTVVERLSRGQVVNLEVTEGSVVELVDVNQDSTPCTRFAGFRVH